MNTPQADGAEQSKGMMHSLKKIYGLTPHPSEGKKRNLNDEMIVYGQKHINELIRASNAPDPLPSQDSVTAKTYHDELELTPLKDDPPLIYDHAPDLDAIIAVDTQNVIANTPPVESKQGKTGSFVGINVDSETTVPYQQGSGSNGDIEALLKNYKLVDCDWCSGMGAVQDGYTSTGPTFVECKKCKGFGTEEKARTALTHRLHQLKYRERRDEVQEILNELVEWEKANGQSLPDYIIAFVCRRLERLEKEGK